MQGAHMELKIETFVDEIHAVINSQIDRRDLPRLPYRVIRQFAPIRRGIQGSFRDVNCSDISTGGISFYLDYAPDFDEFAITLSSVENQIIVIGRVIDHEQMKGSAFYLVHAEFVSCVEQDH
jgi:hypothetical protein